MANLTPQQMREMVDNYLARRAAEQEKLKSLSGMGSLAGDEEYSHYDGQIRSRKLFDPARLGEVDGFNRIVIPAFSLTTRDRQRHRMRINLHRSLFDGNHAPFTAPTKF
jgi:hypothetical protein